MTSTLRNVTSNLLIWVVLPNLPLLVLSYFLWLPYRPASSYFFAFAFVLMSTLPRLNLSDHAKRMIPWIVYGGCAILILADLLFVAVRFFGLLLEEMIASLPMLMHLNVMAYIPYVAFIGIVGLSLAGFVTASRKVEPGQKRDVALTAMVMLALSAYSYTQFEAKANPTIDDDMPFTRAVNASAISPEALLQSDQNLVLVVVEALGQFKDPALVEHLFNAFADPALNDRFDVVRGGVPYYGSTTAAEMRELCASKESYLDVLDDDVDTSSCLPNVLSTLGYDTVTYHGYVADFFEREDWYPKVGFKTSSFAPKLARRAGADVKACGATFKGVCDHQIAAWIKHDLEHAPTKTFAYWLTLNSHFPTRRSDTLERTFPCAQYGLEADGQVCVMADYWMEVFQNAIDIAQAQTGRPTTVLIVGDHAPPILDRNERDRFVPNWVPYVALKPKGDAAAPADAMVSGR